MPLYFVQQRFEHDSALPEDGSSNTLWFIMPDLTAVASMDAVLNSAFTTSSAGGWDPKTYLSDALSGTIRRKWYDHADATPRSPVYESSGSLTIDSAQALPSEMAVCLSFQGAPVSGLPQARRRGRLYFGPLSINAVTDVGQVPHVATNLRNLLLDIGEELHDGAQAAGGTWRVFSPTGNTSIQVDDGWVDDAFDVQRRRGERATTRTTRTF